MTNAAHPRGYDANTTLRRAAQSDTARRKQMVQHRPSGANSKLALPPISRARAPSMNRTPKPLRDGEPTAGPPDSRQVSLTSPSGALSQRTQSRPSGRESAPYF